MSYPLLRMSDAPVSSPSLWPFTGLAPVCPHFSCTGTEPSSAGVSHQCWVGQKDHLPQPAADALPNAAHDAFGLLWCTGSWSNRTTRSFSAQPLSSWLAWGGMVPGVTPLHVQDFTFPFAELCEVPVSPFLQPVQVSLDDSTPTWCINCSSQLCVISQLAQDSIALSRSLMKMLNGTGPRLHLWGTPLLSGVQMDFILLITIL